MTEIKTIMIQKEWHLIGKVYGKKGEEGGGAEGGVSIKKGNFQWFAPLANALGLTLI